MTDWKTVIANVAPTLGTMLGGPLAGTAIAALSKVFLGTDTGNETQLSQAVLTGLTPDKIVELRKLDQDHEDLMKQHDIDLVKLNYQQEQVYVQDTADARKYKDDKVFWMGVVILSIFALCMIACLYGAYEILSGGLHIQDVSTVAAVAGFLGTVVGYIAGNAGQVVSYFFGSSAGSAAKAKDMADSLKSVVAKAK